MGIDKEKAKEALDKVFRDMAGAMTAGMVYVGVETGLFRLMAGKGALASSEITRISGLKPRYVEEWLKGMVAAGYLGGLSQPPPNRYAWDFPTVARAYVKAMWPFSS